MTADNDIRWTSQRGTWSLLLAYYHVDMLLSTPYRCQSNGLCERRIQEFSKIIRVLKLEYPDQPLLEDLGVQRDARTNIKAESEKYATSLKGVFAAGDCRRGQSLAWT